MEGEKVIRGHYIVSARIEVDEGGNLIDIHGEDVVFEQFTGLIDIKGKEIYEGDILGIDDETDGGDNLIPNKDYPYTYWQRSIVAYHPPFARFGLEFYSPYGGEGYTGKDEDISDYIDQGCYVIGNIHENPELLST
jgi:uncharacterized phage protein (TIGR01671 family)